MYCSCCLENINQKDKHTYIVVNKQHSIYKCMPCHDSSRFLTLIDKSGLTKKEKEELMAFKNIMDNQNKKILKLITKLYKTTGIKLFS